MTRNRWMVEERALLRREPIALGRRLARERIHQAPGTSFPGSCARGAVSGYPACPQTSGSGVWRIDSSVTITRTFPRI